MESNINSGTVSEEKSGWKGKWEVRKKNYSVLILGVSNNSGNKHRERKIRKAKQSRRSLFYVATCHFNTWMMDVNLLPG